MILPVPYRTVTKVVLKRHTLKLIVGIHEYRTVTKVVLKLQYVIAFAETVTIEQ